MTYYFEDEVSKMVKDAFVNAKDYDSLYREIYSVLAVIHGNIVGGVEREREIFMKTVRNEAIYHGIHLAARVWDEAFNKKEEN